MTRTTISLLLAISTLALLAAPCGAATERRPVLPVVGERFMAAGQWEINLTYEHQGSNDIRESSGQSVLNPDDVTISFNSLFFSARYGVSSRFNIAATVPYHSIHTRTVQLEPYTRTNRGLGDLLLMTEAAIARDPHLVLELGLELPTADVDRTDEMGQRFTDILALGSETADLVLGSRIWLSEAVHGKAGLGAWIRHRFSGGMNKWGYEFGEETTLGAHGTYPVSSRGRLGLRLEGSHTQPDTWHGTEVPGRGATLLSVGPTASWDVTAGVRFGGFARFPVLMELKGSQVVSRAIIGLTLTTDVNSVVDRLTPRGNGGE